MIMTRKEQVNEKESYYSCYFGIGFGELDFNGNIDDFHSAGDKEGE